MKIKTGNCSNCKNKQVRYFDESGYGSTYCGEKRPSEDFLLARKNDLVI